MAPRKTTKKTLTTQAESDAPVARLFHGNFAPGLHRVPILDTEVPRNTYPDLVVVGTGHALNVRAVNTPVGGRALEFTIETGADAVYSHWYRNLS